MLLTPLFPDAGTSISIRQGHIGDCYLLVIMDALLNGDQLTQQSFKNIFIENLDGSVEVRLRHSELSNNLKMERLRTRGYIYHHDKTNNLDIFTVPKSLLEDFDSSLDGVKSNALAVKILEHIIPYYYFEDWHVDVLLDSVIAHDVRDRHGSKLKSTEFVAAILGFEVKETPGYKIDDVVRFKLKHPDQPVYISMSYGNPDVFGHYHGRHALRIKTIIEKVDGNHEFILVNPWDNSKTETFILNDIKKRHPRFSEFSISKSPAVDNKLNVAFPVQIKSPIESPISIESVVNRTIQEAIRIKNAENTDYSWVMSQEYVLKGILFYTFTNNPHYLTRSGNLRTLFTQISEYGLFELEKHYTDALKELPSLLKSVLELSLNDIPSRYTVDVRRKEELLLRLKNYSETNDLNELSFSEGLRKIIHLNVVLTSELIKELNHQINEVDVSPQLRHSDPVLALDANVINRQKTPDPHIEKRNYDVVDEIINRAISDKENQGLNPEDAKHLIYEGLINYTFYEQLNYVSRSGGLREFLLTPEIERGSKIRLLLDRIDFDDNVNLENVFKISCQYISFKNNLSEIDSKEYLLARLRERRFVSKELPELLIYIFEHTDINLEKLIQKLEPVAVQDEIIKAESPEQPVVVQDEIVKHKSPEQPVVVQDEIINPKSPEQPVVVQDEIVNPKSPKQYEFKPLIAPPKIRDNELIKCKSVNKIKKLLEILSHEISIDGYESYKKVAFDIHLDLKQLLDEYQHTQSITMSGLQANMKKTIDANIHQLNEAPTLVKAFANFFIHLLNSITSLLGFNSQMGLFRPNSYFAVKAFQAEAKEVENDENIAPENGDGIFKINKYSHSI